MQTKLQEIYDHLSSGGLLSYDDYVFIEDYYRGDIPISVLKGRTDTLDNWFFSRFKPNE